MTVKSSIKVGCDMSGMVRFLILHPTEADPVPYSLHCFLALCGLSPWGALFPLTPGSKGSDRFT